MVKNHLKRIATPRTWPILRKENIFVIRPNAGKRIDLCLPLAVVLKELAKVAQTTKQVREVTNAKQILVDKKPIVDFRYPVGLYQSITIVPDKKSHRLTLSRQGTLSLVDVTEAETKIKLCKIVSKTSVKGGKTMIGMLNGNTALVDKKAASYTVGDSLTLDEENKITTHLPLKKDATVQFIGGRHIGLIGSVKSIADKIITVVLDDKTVVETLTAYAFVVGESKPVITIN